MVSTDPSMYLKKKFLTLGTGYKFHENASFRQAAFVELAVGNGECFGSSGYATSCVAFLREDLVEKVSQ